MFQNILKKFLGSCNLGDMDPALKQFPVPPEPLRDLPPDLALGNL